VLVLDEFPYLAQSAPELPSVLQAMVDAPDAKRMPIVICGSSQRMMQGLVLESAAPLYGRAQLLLRLQPLPATEVRAALNLPDSIEAVKVYAAFGGVPRYWDLMREGMHATAEEALERLVFSPQGVLHEEADRVLRDEEAAVLERAVCELIGRGARRPSELAARLGVKDTTLAKPLRHLTDLGIIERQAMYDFETGRPVTGGRRAFYKLADPFLAMWYACVRPHLSGLNLAATTARLHAHEAWTHHVAAVWEDLCRQQWHRLADLGRVLFEIGPRLSEGVFLSAKTTQDLRLHVIQHDGAFVVPVPSRLKRESFLNPFESLLPSPFGLFHLGQVLTILGTESYALTQSRIGSGISLGLVDVLQPRGLPSRAVFRGVVQARVLPALPDGYTKA
jgi:hypothetical protein